MKEETIKFLSTFFNKKDNKVVTILRSLVDKMIILT